MTRARLLLPLLLVLTAAASQAQRLPDDFEIARARAQIQRGDAVSVIAGHLNLGDVYGNRSDRAAAKREYRAALDRAEKERLRARHRSELDWYARATAYAGLASAKLGQRESAWRLFEESLRYTGDSASQWNLYSSAMLVAGDWSKAAAAAANAIAITERNPSLAKSSATLLDLNVYRYARAAALMEGGQSDIARKLLTEVVASLTSGSFDAVRDEVRREEKFEILSSISADADAYLTLLARARLRLGDIYEKSGRVDLARAVYREVLAQRDDEPHALAALARLSSGEGNRIGAFEAAFDASPFSWRLITDYRAGGAHPPNNGISTGSRVRRLLDEIEAKRWTAAEQSVRSLLATNPANESLHALAAEVAAARGDSAGVQRHSDHVSDSSIRAALQQRLRDSAGSDTRALMSRLTAGARMTTNELRQLSAVLRGSLAAEQRTIVDSAVVSADVLLHQPVFDGSTTIASGARSADVVLRFSEPIRFRGRFDAGEVVLTFRVLGASEDENESYLLVEPVKVVREDDRS